MLLEHAHTSKTCKMNSIIKMSYSYWILVPEIHLQMLSILLRNVQNFMVVATLKSQNKKYSFLLIQLLATSSNYWSASRKVDWRNWQIDVAKTDLIRKITYCAILNGIETKHVYLWKQFYTADVNFPKAQLNSLKWQLNYDRPNITFIKLLFGTWYH